MQQCYLGRVPCIVRDRARTPTSLQSDLGKSWSCYKRREYANNALHKQNKSPADEKTSVPPIFLFLFRQRMLNKRGKHPNHTSKWYQPPNAG
ncbi:hypothetical protein BDW75DRAFT_129907 [Aspergillus navahoensis]